MVAGVVEDARDLGPFPLADQVHPQSAIAVAHVLEDVGAVRGRGGAEVRQHLHEPFRPVLVAEQLLRGGHCGAQHGFATAHGAPVHLCGIGYTARPLDPPVSPRPMARNAC